MDQPDFDLDAYLHRLNLHIVRAPTLDTLAALCAAHPASMAFENIDPLLGRPPSLRIADLQAKLIAGQRGGYCFEHNALLREALRVLGFEVRELAARVVWMQPPDAPQRPRTHMLLMVELAGQRYVVDAGFGGHLINLPLRLEAGVEQASPASRLRLWRDDGLSERDEVFTLQTRLPSGWSSLYRFTLDTQSPVDYEPLNWFTATHPHSIFRHNLLMERLTPALRANLLNDRLTLRAPGEPPRMQQIGSAAEFGRVLSEVFGLRLPVPPAELFERVPKRHDGIVMPPPV